MNPDDGQASSRRRRYLIAATSAVGALGLAWAAVPFLKSMLPSERARAVGGPIEVDFSKLEPGSQITVPWRSKPIWILN